MDRDLFGDPVGREEAPAGQVTLALVLHDQGVKAWLLADGLDCREAHWVPKSQCVRGEGRDENQWTMPLWLAKDRGWL